MTEEIVETNPSERNGINDQHDSSRVAHGGLHNQKNPYYEQKQNFLGAAADEKKSSGNYTSHYEETMSDLNTKLSEKTGWILTSLTITKSYFGVGSLAIPWGFLLCGYQLALAMILVNATFSFFSCWTLVEAQKFFGSRKVRTFSDLGQACFGDKGYWFVASVYFVNQAMTGVGYILFFLTQLESVLPNDEQHKVALFILMVLLVPISCFLRSMKHISYLQLVALISLVTAVGTVWTSTINQISEPSFERTFKSFDVKGVPYFFGICIFAFEGNTVTLEIYAKMEHKKRDFTKALAVGIGFATFLFMMTGILFYNAHGQFTKKHFIGNLEPYEWQTYMVKILYAIGVTSGYILQIAPLFNLFDKFIFSGANDDDLERVDPENASRLRTWSIVLRGFLAIITCLLGFVAGDFSTFLNLQGALVGTLISYVLPCLFFLRVNTYVRAMRAREEASQENGDLDPEDREKLLQKMADDELEMEPGHINTDKLADETKIESLQKYLCYIIIFYGSVFGLISFIKTSTHILDSFIDD